MVFAFDFQTNSYPGVLRMLNFFYYDLAHLTHIDPRVYELEKDLELYRFIFWGMIIVLVLLLVIVYLQRVAISGYRKGKESKILPRLMKNKEAKREGVSPEVAAGIISPGNLPDPGLIFKYSLAKENVLDKSISIGQHEGNIKTHSTEVIDHHLTFNIRIIENKRDQDIYNLPDRISEEYQLDLRRDGKVLLYYPGLKGFREMGSRERIYIKKEPDEAGDPTFDGLEAKSPLRFRIGDRLNQDGKFINGYFEFHLFTQDYDVKTKADIPKTEKNFLLRLYKIYPGYDTGSPTDDGLYPMVDPFTTG
jgi:hypothetical protein